MSAPSNAVRRIGPVVNEPVRTYAPGSPERAELKARLAAMEKERPEIPLIIGGKEVFTGDVATVVSPHKHRHVIAKWHKARPKDVAAAIRAALAAQREWASWRDRKSVV